MYVKEIIIENFKCFEGRFRLNLNQGINILVGDNESPIRHIYRENQGFSGFMAGTDVLSR